MADTADLSPLDKVKQLLGIQTDAEIAMLSRRTAEANAGAVEAIRARGGVVPKELLPPTTVPVTKPIASGMDRTAAGSLKQHQDLGNDVMSEYNRMYGPK